MTRQDFLNDYWRYYMHLERRFIHTMDYVDLDNSNSSTFSNEYANLLLSICSELDSFFKVYCGYLPSERKTITDYASFVLADYPDITKQEITVYSSKQTLKPFDGWNITKASESIDWWNAFNNVKHSRVANKKEATQEKVLKALAALYLVEMKYLRKIADSGKEIDIPDKESTLFTPKGWTFNYASAGSLVLQCDGDEIILGG